LPGADADAKEAQATALVSLAITTTIADITAKTV
jgi:hypothetical protein